LQTAVRQELLRKSTVVAHYKSRQMTGINVLDVSEDVKVKVGEETHPE
jgi:hypothetical protein